VSRSVVGTYPGAHVITQSTTNKDLGGLSVEQRKDVVGSPVE
jgi:hypothetical protein